MRFFPKALSAGMIVSQQGGPPWPVLLLDTGRRLQYQFIKEPDTAAAVVRAVTTHKPVHAAVVTTDGLTIVDPLRMETMQGRRDDSGDVIRWARDATGGVNDELAAAIRRAMVPQG